MAGVDGPARVIFFARQGTLQTASVNSDPELKLDRVEPLGHADLGGFAPQISIESQDLGRKLVCGFGAALSGKQTGQTGRRQRGLRLIKGWSRHPEVCCHRADHLAVHLVAANHLVAHLDQIGGIKEGVVSEQRVANGFGMGIERAVASQRFPLAICGRCLGHCRPVVCNDKYAALYVVSSINPRYSARNR
jgi:hypothetical protein